jgi:hypothetical protein
VFIEYLYELLAEGKSELALRLFSPNLNGFKHVPCRNSKMASTVLLVVIFETGLIISRATKSSEINDLLLPHFNIFTEATAAAAVARNDCHRGL